MLNTKEAADVKRRDLNPVHTNNFYATTFICHVYINCHTKTGQLCSYTQANKNCNINLARVDGA